MADENIEDPNMLPENEHVQLGSNDSKPKAKMAIVGYNLLILAAYTLLFRLLAEQGGFIFDAFLLACHVFACLIMSLVNRSWMWVLSGVLVLAIGFSTCVMMADVSGLK